MGASTLPAVLSRESQPGFAGSVSGALPTEGHGPGWREGGGCDKPWVFLFQLSIQKTIEI